MTHDGRSLKNSYIVQAKEQWKKDVMTTPVRLEVDLFFGDNRRRDIDNWHKILLDSLTGVIWKDDSQIVYLAVTKGIDKENPRIELRLI